MARQTVLNIILGGIDNIPPYNKSIINIISRKTKDFNLENYNKIAIINTNNIDIGIIGFNLTEEELIVRTFQSPNVCRLSILSLIDSSVKCSQELLKDYTNLKYVRFKNVNYAHTFKIKQIFKEIGQEENDFLVDRESISLIPIEAISLKNIIIEKI